MKNRKGRESPSRKSRPLDAQLGLREALLGHPVKALIGARGRTLAAIRTEGIAPEGKPEKGQLLLFRGERNVDCDRGSFAWTTGDLQLAAEKMRSFFHSEQTE